MSTQSLQLARNLKFSRFTIDVLTQRLERLHGRCLDKCGQGLAEAKRAVQSCDRLHNDLRDRIRRAQSFDAEAIACLLAAFDELNRRVEESVAQCNVCEFGDPLRSV